MLSSWRKIPAQRSPKCRKSVMSFSRLCVSLLFQQVAPTCNNMTLFSDLAQDCRIRSGSVGQPFSGVKGVSNFCAHQHKDITNKVGGCTVILTLKKEIILIPRMKSFMSCLSTSWMPAVKKSSYETRDGQAGNPRTIVIPQSE